MSCSDPCQVVQVEPCWVPVDYLMRIGTTNVYFVASLQAILRPWGPEFRPQDMHQAELRAASTLAQTALIRGMSLKFLRDGIPWTEAQSAAFLGVPLPTLQAWEAETVETPRDMWLTLADHVAHLDGRSHYDIPPPCPRENWQGRVIRVYPDFPTVSTQPPLGAPGGCTPC